MISNNILSLTACITCPDKSGQAIGADVVCHLITEHIRPQSHTLHILNVMPNFLNRTLGNINFAICLY